MTTSTTIQVQPLPPVPTGQDILFPNSTRMSQGWLQWMVQLRDKVNVINSLVASISGSTSSLGAFNLLSPLTTNGDMITYDAGNNIRLAIGSNGQILSVVSGLPSWVDPSAGSSPLTTKGDLYTFTTTNGRLPVGPDTYVLSANASQPTGLQWVPAGTPSLPVTTKGDLLGFSTVPARVPVGTDGQALLADSTQATGVKWGAAGSSSPLTTKGDLYGFSTANARIPVGSDGQSLLADSSQLLGVRWGTPTSKYAQVVDIETQGTAGGAGVVGINTRVLNTIVTDGIGITLASNQVTLPAGIYYVQGIAPFYRCGRTAIYLYNITSASLQLRGVNNYAGNALDTGGNAIVEGFITIATSTVFELRQYFQAIFSPNTLGVAINDASVGSERYASLYIWKL